MSRLKPLFIDGRPVETERRALIRSPYDGHEVAEVALGSSAEMEAATLAAVRAFGVTRRLTRRQRADVLHRVASGVARRKEEIAATMTDEMGKPLQFSRAEVDRCVTTFTLAAEEARRWTGEMVPVDIEPHTSGFQAFTVIVPLAK